VSRSIRGAPNAHETHLDASMAMIAGMIPMALDLAEGAQDGASRTGRDRGLFVCYRRDFAGSASVFSMVQERAGVKIAVTRP